MCVCVCACHQGSVSVLVATSGCPYLFSFVSFGGGFYKGVQHNAGPVPCPLYDWLCWLRSVTTDKLKPNISPEDLDTLRCACSGRLLHGGARGGGEGGRSSVKQRDVFVLCGGGHGRKVDACAGVTVSRHSPGRFVSKPPAPGTRVHCSTPCHCVSISHTRPSVFPLWTVCNAGVATVGSQGLAPRLYIGSVAWKAQYRWARASIISFERP